MSVQETKYVLQAKNIFDENKRVRYLMERTWDTSKPSIAIIMYNPVRLDPHPYTLGRTLSGVVAAVMRSYQRDFGSIRVVNLIPHLSDSKKDLPRKLKVFDPQNFKYVRESVTDAKMTVLFWGNKGKSVSRHPQFVNLMHEHIEKLRCFGVTKSNEPSYIYSLKEVSPLYKVQLSPSGYALGKIVDVLNDSEV